MNQKTLYVILLTLFINKTHCMELISPTVQDRVITSALIIGASAASGATFAIATNTINKYFDPQKRCSIYKSMAFSALFALPVVAAAQCGSWPKLSKNDFILLLASDVAVKAFVVVEHSAATLGVSLGKKIRRNRFFQTPDDRTSNAKDADDTLHLIFDNYTSRAPFFVPIASASVSTCVALLNRYTQ